MFAIGVLAGYGGRKVFIWLDYQVARLFKLKKPKEEAEKYKKVPNLVGMTKEEAEKALADANLTLGNVSTQTTNKRGSVGNVIAQEPKPELSLAAESLVDITIGIAEEG
jgi:beta-lactam-binding protein with PASTA domain